MDDPLTEALAGLQKQDYLRDPFYAAGSSMLEPIQTYEGDSIWDKILMQGAQNLVGGTVAKIGQNRADSRYQDQVKRLEDYAGFAADPTILADSIGHDSDPLVAALAPAYRADASRKRRAIEDDIAKHTTDLAFDRQKANEALNSQLVLALAKDHPEMLGDDLRKSLGLRPMINTADAAPKAPASPLLAPGAKPTSQKLTEYYHQFRNEGMPETQAAAAARQQLEGEIKANAGSFDAAKEAREYGQKMIQLADTADMGMSKAGKTGNMQGVRSFLDAVNSNLNPFGGEESRTRRQGDQELESIGPEIVKMSRSPGALSDYETRMYLKSGPSVYNLPETNRVLVDKMKELGKLHMEYADFIDAYRDANSGSTIGADKMWMEYRKATPLIVPDEKTGDLRINTNRTPWQEFFAKRGGGMDDMKPDSATAAFESELGAKKPRYTDEELIAAGYVKGANGWHKK